LLSGKNRPQRSIEYACGDFWPPPRGQKNSHVLATKAIFRGVVYFYLAQGVTAFAFLAEMGSEEEL